MGGSKATIVYIKGVHSKEPQTPSQIDTLFLGCEESRVRDERDATSDKGWSSDKPG